MRFYCKNISNNVEIEDDEFKHIVKVMRLGIGDEICLFNGDGYNYFASITEIKKQSLVAKITKKETNENEPQKKISLFLSLLKGEKMELVAQKITELGANELVLFESQNSDRKQGNLNMERLNKIAVSASKQCGRSSVISICERTFDEVCELLKTFDLVLVAHEKIKEKTIKSVLNKLDETKYQGVAIVVGPEGGLAEQEILEFEKIGAECVSLGKLILRAETASISTVSVVATKFLLN